MLTDRNAGQRLRRSYPDFTATISLHYETTEFARVCKCEKLTTVNGMILPLTTSLPSQSLLLNLFVLASVAAVIAATVVATHLSLYWMHAATVAATGSGDCLVYSPRYSAVGAAQRSPVVNVSWSRQSAVRVSVRVTSIEKVLRAISTDFG